jgi:hypothetical protein
LSKAKAASPLGKVLSVVVFGVDMGELYGAI